MKKKSSFELAYLRRCKNTFHPINEVSQCKRSIDFYIPEVPYLFR